MGHKRCPPDFRRRPTLRTRRSSDAVGHGLGDPWAILETWLKWHTSCWPTHPSADAVRQEMETYHLKAEDILTVTAHVHRAAIDVIEPARAAATHQAKFSMPCVLGLIAVPGYAIVGDFNEASSCNPQICAFMDRVTMVEDPETESAYPERRLGKITTKTLDDSVVQGRVNATHYPSSGFFSVAGKVAGSWYGVPVGDTP